MENSALFARVVGQPGSDSWPQVFIFSPQEEKEESKGILFGAIAFRVKEKIEDIAGFGRNILSRLYEEYYKKTEATSLLERLSFSVLKIVQEFKEETEIFEIIAASIYRNILYLASFGEGEVWIKRGEDFKRVLKGEETASGFVEPGDFIIIGTSSFFSFLSQEKIQEAFRDENCEKAGEILTSTIYSQGDGFLTAGLICQIVQKKEVLKEKSGLFEKIKKYCFKNFSFVSLRGLNQEEERKKMGLSLAIILILLFLISIFFGKKQLAIREKEEKYNLLYSEIIKDFKEGKDLLPSNQKLAKEFILKSWEKIGELESLKIESSKTEKLKKEIEEFLPLILKEYKLSEVPLFLDLGLFRQGGRGDKLSLFGDFMVVLDSRENVLFGINISQKSGEILIGEKDLSGQTKSVAVYENYVYVLGERGIFQVETKGKEKKVVVEPDWEEERLLSVFAGNLYVLDKKGIWRYSKGANFSNKESWFKEKEGPEWGSFISWAIDGSIWLLRKDGQILKLVQGSSSIFNPKGLEKSFSSPTKIYTSSESNNLYILDNGNKRLVVLGKGGEYRGEYIWEGLEKISDMVVSEEKRKIFLLEEDKIYQIELR